MHKLINICAKNLKEDIKFLKKLHSNLRKKKSEICNSEILKKLKTTKKSKILKHT